MTTFTPDVFYFFSDGDDNAAIKAAAIPKLPKAVPMLAVKRFSL